MDDRMTRLPDDQKKYAALMMRLSGHLVIRSSLCLIRLYQLCLSPWLGTNCRFAPSCSHYAQEAVMQHGVMKGGLLTLRRLSRCHPLGGCGYDPVP